MGIACMPFFIYVTEGVGGYAAPRDLLFSYPNTLNDPYWQPTHVARDLMIALMPVARGLPGKMMMLSTLAQGTAAQPVGAFGNRGLPMPLAWQTFSGPSTGSMTCCMLSPIGYDPGMMNTTCSMQRYPWPTFSRPWEAKDTREGLFPYSMIMSCTGPVMWRGAFSRNT